MFILLCHLLLCALNTAVKRYFHKRGQRRVSRGRKNMFTCVQAQTYTNRHKGRVKGLPGSAIGCWAWPCDRKEAVVVDTGEEAE